jgi:exodeoxyribonuclease-3
MDFFEHFLAHLSKVLNNRREIIISGNWNIAHKTADEQEPADNTGFIAQEKQMITQLYQELGYGDAFRLSCSDDDEYTWWPDENRDKGGRRIDTQVVSEGLIGSVEYAFIYKNQAFSNHAPVVVDYEYDLF